MSKSNSFCTKKIAIVGPESTGKSNLTLALAQYLGMPYVLEQSRGYLSEIGTNYTQADVEQIARLQIAAEDLACQTNPEFLICDTNLIVIKIWMDNAFGSSPSWIIEAIKTRRYALHLLTDTDIPWVPDPLREHPHLREYFLEKYKEALNTYSIKYYLISGTEESRLNLALNAISAEGNIAHSAEKRLFI